MKKLVVVAAGAWVRPSNPGQVVAFAAGGNQDAAGNICLLSSCKAFA